MHECLWPDISIYTAVWSISVSQITFIISSVIAIVSDSHEVTFDRGVALSPESLKCDRRL